MQALLCFINPGLSKYVFPTVTIASRWLRYGDIFASVIPRSSRRSSRSWNKHHLREINLILICGFPLLNHLTLHQNAWQSEIAYHNSIYLLPLGGLCEWNKATSPGISVGFLICGWLLSDRSALHQNNGNQE